MRCAVHLQCIGGPLESHPEHVRLVQFRRFYVRGLAVELNRYIWTGRATPLSQLYMCKASKDVPPSIATFNNGETGCHSVEPFHQ